MYISLYTAGVYLRNITFACVLTYTVIKKIKILLA